MKAIYLFIIICLCTSCNYSNKSDSENFLDLQLKYDSIQQLSAKVIFSLVNLNWEKEFLHEIYKTNSSFKIENKDSLKFIFVPTLSIPIFELKEYKDNFQSFFHKGKFEIADSRIYVVKENKPIGIFSVRKKSYGDNLYSYFPLTFHKSLSNSKIIDIINESKLNFIISIKVQIGSIFIPDVVNYINDYYMIYNSTEEKNYPIEEIYRSWIIPDKEKFRKFITSGKVK